MKFLVMLLILTSCGPNTELLETSKSRIAECNKACKADYGEDAELEWIGSITGTCYCKEK